LPKKQNVCLFSKGHATFFGILNYSFNEPEKGFSGAHRRKSDTCPAGFAAGVGLGAKPSQGFPSIRCTSIAGKTRDLKPIKRHR
jgi:hypothetical protein